MSDSKPRVLVLGGCGFVGRHFVTHLVENDLASFVLVVDKVPPAMAWLNQKHKQAFDSSIVEFKSANLLAASSREGVFAIAGGSSSVEWDYVVNLAAETKPNQNREVYHAGIVPLSVGCAQLAAQHRVKRFVELSTSHCYSAKKKPAKETEGDDPYTVIAECKLEVEKALAEISNLNYVVLRPAVIYGTADRVGLTPWLILGAIYRHLSEPLKLLWHAEVHNNTVHVSDVCRAIWHACTSSKVASGDVLNVADSADTTLGSLAQLTADLFEIKFSFVGKVLSALAKLDLRDTAEVANDKHLPPWAELCQASGINNTPLSPYATVENLSGRNLWLDNSKLLEATGFEIGVPRPTVETFREIVEDFASMGLFPPLDK